MVAMFTDDSQAMLRVLALHENGQAQPGLDYPVAGSPCAQVVGRAYRYLACGVRAQGRVPGLKQDQRCAAPLAMELDVPSTGSARSPGP